MKPETKAKALCCAVLEGRPFTVNGLVLSCNRMQGHESSHLLQTANGLVEWEWKDGVLTIAAARSRASGIPL